MGEVPPAGPDSNPLLPSVPLPKPLCLESPGSRCPEAEAGGKGWARGKEAAFSLGSWLPTPFPGVMLAREVEAGVAGTLGDPWSPDYLSRSQAADTSVDTSRLRNPGAGRSPQPGTAHPWRSGPCSGLTTEPPEPAGLTVSSVPHMALVASWSLSASCGSLSSACPCELMGFSPSLLLCPHPPKAAPEHPPCPALSLWPQAAALIFYPWAWPQAPPCCPDLTWAPPPRPFTASVPGTLSWW